MKISLLFFCVWLFHTSLPAQELKLQGIYTSDAPLSLHTESITLVRCKDAKDLENCARDNAPKTIYSWHFKAQSQLEIQAISAPQFSHYSEDLTIQIAWENEALDKHLFIFTLLVYDVNQSKKILQRSLFKISQSDAQRIHLEREKVLERIVYDESMPFSTHVAPPLQENAHIAPIIGKYLAIIRPSSTSQPLSKKLPDIELYALSEEKTPFDITTIRNKTGLNTEKASLYYLTFHGNNNIEVREVHPHYISEKELSINIGQWEYIDHENYAIKLLASYKGDGILHALKGEYRILKKQPNKLTLKLKTQEPATQHNKLLYYYQHYFKRLENPQTAQEKPNKIIGYYTHQAKLDFSNNYLPMRLEKHGNKEMAELFLEDIPRRFGQILHFKADNSIEIIDILNNNPVPIPSAIYWYPSIDNNTYILKYKAPAADATEENWMSVLYTFQKQDIHSFVLEKWVNIATHTIIHHH